MTKQWYGDKKKTELDAPEVEGLEDPAKLLGMLPTDNWKMPDEDGQWMPTPHK